MVFELEREVTVEEVNAALKEAAEGQLAGILGFEARPLVSIDYRTDPRSAIIDALSTMVVNGTQLKLYAWYDNEWGYANRTAELALQVGGTQVGRG
jgi:glyceraldehyde 3-phosphate dehydrogenase